MNKYQSNTGKIIPLSFSQRRICFLQHLYDDNVMYNVNRVFRVQGPLDLEALQLTLQTLALRHEPLRTRFRIAPDGSPCQVVDDIAKVKIDYMDLSAVQGSHQLPKVRKVIQEAVVRPFKLYGELMIRAMLVRLNASEVILLFVQHHIITDDSSWCLFLAEFTTAYSAILKGEAPNFSPLPWAYSDFAQKQAQLNTRDITSNKLQYWRDFFDGFTWPEQKVDSCLEHVSKVAPISYATSWQHIPTHIINSCVKVAEKQNCTLFIVVLTAISLLVRFLYGHSQVLICMASANRQHPGAEQVLGCFFANVIVTLNILPEQKLAKLIQNVKSKFTIARQQQDMPFEMFAEDLGLKCTRQGKPPYHIYISYRSPAYDVPFSLPDVHLTPIEVSTGRNTQEDIVFNFWEKSSDGGLSLDLEWLCRSDVFDQNDIEKLPSMLELLITCLNRDIDQKVNNLKDSLMDSGFLCLP